MASFGKASEAALQGIHPDIIRVLRKAIERYDFGVLNGLRTEAQEAADVAAGLSQTMHSMHLQQADGYGHAADIAPYPENWNDPSHVKLSQFEVDQIFLGAFVLGVAHALGIELRYGGNWSGSGRSIAAGFKDLDHVELPAGHSTNS